jgi:hypothetical protein
MRELERITPALQAAHLSEQLAHAISTIDELRSALAAPADPEAERLHFLLFAVTADDREMIQLALARSGELAGAPTSLSQRLGLMALDFLATNNFSIADEEQRLKFLQKFEVLLGYKLVILDPTTYEVRYGMGTVEKAAQPPVPPSAPDARRTGSDAPAESRRDQPMST